MAVLKLNNVSKNYRKNFVLKEITVELHPGVYGLIGPNGAGKTTLFRLINAIDETFSGTITIDDMDFKNPSYAQHIGFLPQHFNGFSDLSTERMLEYFAALFDVKKDCRKEKIEKCLELVNLKEERNKKLSKLSGGMRRRVGIAQTLLHDPEILIYDEPTAGLDPEEQIRFLNLIRKIKKDKIVIISSHNINELASICDQFLIIDKGKLLKMGTNAEISAIAENKTYNIKERDRERIEGEYFLVKEEVDKDELNLHIVTKQIQKMEPVRPTLEDGYLCGIKGY